MYAQDPPFLLQNGDNDCNIGTGQGLLLLNALKRAGISATPEMFPGKGHGGEASETQEHARKVVDFL